MSDGIMKDALADALWGDGSQAAMPLMWGTVKSIDGGSIGVSVRGSSTFSCAKLSSYTPTVGDRVVILELPGAYVAIGKIG